MRAKQRGKTMNALIRMFKALNYRTILILVLVGLLLVPAVTTVVADEHPAAGAEVKDDDGGGPADDPKPTPEPPTKDFAWGG